MLARPDPKFIQPVQRRRLDYAGVARRRPLASNGLNYAVSGASSGRGEGRKIKDALLARETVEQVDFCCSTGAFVPTAVKDELLHPDAPEAFREWPMNRPSWISVDEASVRSAPGLERLRVG